MLSSDEFDRLGLKRLDEVQLLRTEAKSDYEQWTMRLLDVLDIKWEYEPSTVQLSDTKEKYIPDFWLPELGTFIECKSGSLPQRMRKPWQFSLDAYRLSETNDESVWWYQEHLTCFVLWDNWMLHRDVKAYGCNENVDTFDQGTQQIWCNAPYWSKCGACRRWQLVDPCNGWQCRGEGCMITGKTVFTGGTVTHDRAISYVKL